MLQVRGFVDEAAMPVVVNGRLSVARRTHLSQVVSSAGSERATFATARESAGDLRLRARGEGGGLLMPDMDPVDGGVAPDGVDDRVEAVADHSVQALDARADKDVDELFGDVLLGHASRTPL